MLKKLILAGGDFDLLFPITRKNIPKQFKKFGKHSGYIDILEDQNTRSLFQEMVQTITSCIKPGEKVYVLTKNKYKFHVVDQLTELGLQERKHYELLLQDDSTNAGEAIRKAFLELASDSKPTALLFLPSDVEIMSRETFLQEIKNFEELVENDDGPERMYIIASEKQTKYSIFVELPTLTHGDLVKVKRITRDAKDNLLQFTDIFAIRNTKTEILQTIEPQDDYYTIIKKYEKRTLAYVPQYTAFIHEVNTIEELSRTKSDAYGNHTIGNATIKNSYDTTVYNETRAHVIAGSLKNIAIINTGDVVLVYPRDDEETYLELLQNVDPQLIEHGPTSYKPWGRYMNIFESDYFKIKILEILPGQSISLQKHYHRSEHWIIVSGTAKVRIGDEEKIVRTGESVYVPIGELHKLSNPGKIPLKVVEVQYGEYLEEDDIVRYEDKYGRVEKDDAREEKSVVLKEEPRHDFLPVAKREKG